MCSSTEENIVPGRRGFPVPASSALRPVPLARGAEAEVVAEAERILAQADSRLFPTGGARVLTFADWLRDDLETYGDLESRRAHPSSVFPELAEWPEDALRQALEMTAEDIAADARALARIIAELEGGRDDAEDGESPLLPERPPGSDAKD
jgi:hypothetical protein